MQGNREEEQMQGNREKEQNHGDRGSDGHKGSMSGSISVPMPSVLSINAKGRYCWQLVVIDFNK
jgi:hypothetical protein